MANNSTKENYASSTLSYSKALNACKCECLLQKDGTFIVTGDVWTLNQAKLRQTRKNMEDDEKDKLMKQALFQKLNEQSFDKQSAHTVLQFPMVLEIDRENNSNVFSFCEACYVSYNEHRSKFHPFVHDTNLNNTFNTL